MKSLGRKGRHGWFVVGGIPWFATLHKEAVDDAGAPKKDDQGNQLYTRWGHMRGSDWGCHGPFKNRKAAAEWFRKNAIEGRPMSFEPWYVIKRFVRAGAKEAFSATELRYLEEMSVEFVEHRRVLKRPRKARVRLGMWLEGEPAPPRVTVSTREPKSGPRYSIRFVRKKTG